MSDATRRGAVPMWYWIITVLLVLWGIMGCYAFYLHMTLGADAMPGATDYDRVLYGTLPDWYHWTYGVAVISGLLGALALIARSGLAQAVFLISLIAVLVQFGWLFATSDIIAAKGAAATVPFPLFIAGVAAFSVWFAGFASGRGWLR